MGATTPTCELSTPNAWLVRWFTWYCRRYALPRGFHAVRLAREGRPRDVGGPLIVVLNHPSWWDPLLCAALTGLFPGRTHYTPIDSRMLARYGIFRRLGFFGVEQGTDRGARGFLRLGGEAVRRPGAMLWMTGQGRLTDPRERPVRLKPGFAHLLRRLDGGTVLPLALEYPFWDERYPEALARFGKPVSIGRGHELSVGNWVQRLEAGLGEAQDALATAARARDPQAFEILVSGRAGVGGIYDGWRRLRARLRSERFRAAHGADDAPTAVGSLP